MPTDVSMKFFGFFQLQDGKVVPVCVNVGDKVLLPEYGGTKVEFEEKVM